MQASEEWNSPWREVINVHHEATTHIVLNWGINRQAGHVTEREWPRQTGQAVRWGGGAMIDAINQASLPDLIFLQSVRYDPRGSYNLTLSI